MSYIKVVGISVLSGFVLFGFVMCTMTGRELDAYTYETVSSSLDLDDEDGQWRGETLSLCQGKNVVASDGISDGISFCQKVPESVASQKVRKH
jgi:hypothetical protein